MAKLKSTDFENQFFKKEHYEAFEMRKQDDDSYDNERRDVADRLLDLDQLLWPEVLKHGWHIHRHPMQEHWTSLWRVSQSRSNKLNAVWLHYGKSDIELDTYKPYHSEANPQTFIHHIRLQLVVRESEFEIGLILGKNDGGGWDRQRYRDLMNDTATKAQIWQMLSTLDNEYWLDFKGIGESLKTFKTADELWQYTRVDRPAEYFTFGKSISPDDSRINNDNIIKTIITEFKKLYPLYNIIKHRF